MDKLAMTIAATRFRYLPLALVGSWVLSAVSLAQTPGTPPACPAIAPSAPSVPSANSASTPTAQPTGAPQQAPVPTPPPQTSQVTLPAPATPPSTPSLTKTDLDHLQSSLAKLEASVEELKGSRILRDWTPIGAAVLTAIVALVSLLRTTQTNVRLAQGLLIEKSREEERKAIREQINGFYAPFLQLRSSSSMLYKQAFLPRRTDEERRLYADTTGQFRTLVALIKGHKFKGTDEVLLQQIVEIGQKTATLIYDKVGLVTDPVLQKALARATSHFRLMQLALVNSEKFTESGKEFDDFTFPADLDDMVQKTLDQLNARLKALTTSP